MLESAANFVIAMAVRGGIALVLGAGMAALVRRQSASVRYAAWMMGLSAAVVIPAMMPLVPSFALPVLASPIPTPWHAVAAPSLATPAADHDAAVTASPVAPSRPAGTPWPTMVFSGWIVGFAIVVVRLIANQLSARRAIRAAVPAPHALQLEFDDVLASLGANGPYVTLLVSSDAHVPFTAGLITGRIIIPADALGWSVARRRTALIHEFAHVHRRDCLWDAIATASCAMHWFNPLSWFALARTRALREEASDDTVLRAGIKPSSYCEYLMQSAGVRPPGNAVVAMVTGSTLESRVARIVSTTARRGTITAAQWAIGAVLLITLATGAAGARPVIQTSLYGPNGRGIVGSVVCQRALRSTGRAVQFGDGEVTGAGIAEDADQNLLALWGGAGCSMLVRRHGVMFYSARGDNVVAMLPGGTLDIEYERNRIVHHLRFVEASGRIDRFFDIDGRPVPADSAMQWSADAIFTFVREIVPDGDDCSGATQRLPASLYGKLITIADENRYPELRDCQIASLLSGPKPAVRASDMLNAIRDIPSSPDRAILLAGIAPVMLTPSLRRDYLELVSVLPTSLHPGLLARLPTQSETR